MNYYFTDKWEKNTVKQFNRKCINKEVTVLAQELPKGAKIVLRYEAKAKAWDWSLDFKNSGPADSYLNKYFEKFIYTKLTNIINEFAELDINLYGYISKSGLIFSDMRVNNRFISWDLAGKLFEDCKVETPKIIYEGIYKDFSHHKINSDFLIRSLLEHPDKRRVYCRKAKSLQKKSKTA